MIRLKAYRSGRTLITAYRTMDEAQRHADQLRVDGWDVYVWPDW